MESDNQTSSMACANVEEIEQHSGFVNITNLNTTNHLYFVPQQNTTEFQASYFEQHPNQQTHSHSISHMGLLIPATSVLSDKKYQVDNLTSKRGSIKIVCIYAITHLFQF